MSNKPHDVTAKVVIEFTRNLFETLADKYGGDSTLNELRVMNQLISCSLKARTCTVTGIHKATGIPIPTVSRSVAHLQSKGWLSEQQDPDDGRKRLICLSRQSLELTSNDIDERVQWLNYHRDHGLPD
jgi:DNA-binding MarR family transcriptional regulator